MVAYINNTKGDTDIIINNGRGGGHRSSRYDTVAKCPPGLFQVLNVLRKAQRNPAAFAAAEAIKGLIRSVTDYSDAVGMSDDLFRLLIDYGVVLHFERRFLFDREAGTALLRACQERQRLMPPTETRKRERFEMLLFGSLPVGELEERKDRLEQQLAEIQGQLTQVTAELERRGVCR